MSLVTLGLGLFVGALCGILFLMLCVAAKTGDVKMYELETDQKSQCRHNVYALSARKNKSGPRNVIQEKDIGLLYTQ